MTYSAKKLPTRELLSKQRGIGFWGLMMVLILVGFFALIAFKVGPIYLNHAQIVRALNNVGSSGEFSNAPPTEIRRALQKRWDVDYISRIEPKDIKIKRTKDGKVLAYQYIAEEKLFYNVHVAAHFEGEVPLQ